jgi:Mg-chelatase subunit ChlD
MTNQIAPSTPPDPSLFDDLTSNKFFATMIKNLSGEREQLLVQGGNPPTNVTVDICFCLDCTGSMSRWLSETKVQMKVIISGINREIKKEYPSLKLQLRFAIVGFRDVGDNPRFFIQQFTDQEAQLISFLDSLTAAGGGDCPEDVMGALDQCLKLNNWSKSNARFIVLITDAPGHGTELNDDPTDQYKNGTEHSMKSICDRLLKENDELDLMFCCIKPNYTKKMELAFKARYDAVKEKSGKAFTVIKLFDEQQQVPQAFHFVFVLDESGSMSGSPWNALVAAYQSFLARRQNDQGGDDLFSVVQFSSGARIICQRQRLSTTPQTLHFGNGGTTYIAGLQSADTVIAGDTSTSSVVMIFMSDGGDGGPNPLPKINEFHQKYRNKNFICHTVAFGSGVSQGSSAAQLLQNMATQGGGKLYYALNNADLVSAFSSIAANCTVSGTLVDRFAEILSREISVKIMVDYL